MASTSEIRNGLCINYSNDIYSIIEFLHVKPGKGAAFVRTKMKSMTTGKVIDNTFPAGHKIDIVRVERRKYQYLYKDDLGFHFMDNETYEQTTVPETIIPNPDFILEGATIEILFDASEGTPISAEMPQYLEFKITYTEPGIKGDTATNATKPATIETGAEIRVPLFIQEGDIVKINTQTGDYMERIKQ